MGASDKRPAGPLGEFRNFAGRKCERAATAPAAGRGSPMKKIKVKKVEKILATATAVEYGL